MGEMRGLGVLGFLGFLVLQLLISASASQFPTELQDAAPRLRHQPLRTGSSLPLTLHPSTAHKAGPGRWGDRLSSSGATSLMGLGTEGLRGGGGQEPELAKVLFKRKAPLKESEALYIVGDCAVMGSDEMVDAVPMTLNGGVWEVEIDKVPIGTRYKYVAAVPTDVKETVRLTANPNYKLQVHRPADSKPSTPIVLDNTVQLVRFEVGKTAGEVKIVGSLSCLGLWAAEKAPKMTCNDHNVWTLVLPIPSDELNDFKYKYMADGTYEDGNNRISDAADVEPQEEDGGWITTLRAVWEGLLIRFMIFHPINEPGARMAITGGHPGLGSWQKSDSWCRMGLGNERTLLTAVRGRCWEATFPAPAEDFTDVTYRYIILNDEKKTAVWESEPNRKLSFIPGAVSSGGKVGQGFRKREFTVFDGNFVAKELQFDWVPPCLFVGPYPQSLDDVTLMKEAGVTGVVNVQTQKDIDQRMVNMDAMRGYYNDAGIELRHVPIEDFHGADLAARVKFAAKACHELMENARNQGKEGKIYIHCTAGMGRAPATACIYLVWKHGYNLDSARDHVKHHRPIVAPNYNAMKEALQNGLDC